MLGNFRDNQPRKRDSHVGRVEGLTLRGRGGKRGIQALTGADKEGGQKVGYASCLQVSSQGQLKSSH